MLIRNSLWYSSVLKRNKNELRIQIRSFYLFLVFRSLHCTFSEKIYNVHWIFQVIFYCFSLTLHGNFTNVDYFILYKKKTVSNEKCSKSIKKCFDNPELGTRKRDWYCRTTAKHILVANDWILLRHNKIITNLQTKI